MSPLVSAGSAPRPIVVGILNATPDSFYDGGRWRDLVARGEQLVEAGADWLDLGGESTRPGAEPVDAEEEWRRVGPVLEGLRGTVPLCIDTTKPQVARRAAAAGARVLNDVRGLEDPQMAEVSEEFQATVVMHSRGTPQTMGRLTAYADLVAEVRDLLLERAARARSPEVLLDPGIGFAKTAPQSLALLRHLDRLVETGLPVYIGASRKSFIGRTLGLPGAEDRLAGSLAAAAAAYHCGAVAFRVHDVAEHRQLLDLLAAVRSAEPAPAGAAPA